MGTRSRSRLAVLAALAVGACTYLPIYHTSVGMEMLPNPDPSGGLIDPPILSPIATFLSAKGYGTTRNDNIAAVLTMERRADTVADRIEILEARHDQDPAGWLTVEVDGSTFVVQNGKYKIIKPSDAVRADADSVIAKIRQPEH